MANSSRETETKILDVDKKIIESRLIAIGAKKILDTRFEVSWFRKCGLKDGEDPWFLRLRKSSDGSCEITWKGISTKLGAARTHDEISFVINNPQKMVSFLQAIGLEQHAYQEKYRTSWVFNDWRFDLDQYPDMPAYLEIEGQSEEHIQEAIKLLELEGHEASPEGERVIIQKKYGINWHDMRFQK